MTAGPVLAEPDRRDGPCTIDHLRDSRWVAMANNSGKRRRGVREIQYALDPEEEAGQDSSEIEPTWDDTTMFDIVPQEDRIVLKVPLLPAAKR